MKKYDSTDWGEMAEYEDGDYVKAEVAEKLYGALVFLMASVGGGKKPCSHNFTCICAQDAVNSAIQYAKEN